MSDILKTYNDKTTNPALIDDLAHNYLIGQTWININTREQFICVDNTTNNAIWKSITNPDKYGFVEEWIYCINSDGMVVNNLSSNMVKKGGIISKIELEVLSEFDGTLTNFIVTRNDNSEELISDLSNGDLTTTDLYTLFEQTEIFTEDTDLSINITLTGATEGEAFLKVTYVNPMIYYLDENESLYFTGNRKIMFIKYIGETDTVSTINFMGTEISCGDVSGNFVFDINDDINGYYEFTTINETNSFVYNGYTNTITYLGKGSHNFNIVAIEIDYILKSFGINDYGQIGMGTVTNYSGVIQTPNFDNIKSIHCGRFHTIIVFNDGTIKSFGDNTFGQLGMENTTNYNGSICTPSITNIKSASCGAYHTILLLNDGTIKSFGLNSLGELGMGDLTNYGSVIQTPSFTNVLEISSGMNHNILLLNDGTIKTFGRNDYGQIGMGNTTNYSGAVCTPSFTNITSISCGAHHTILLFNDGTIKSFGYNTYGELGMGNTTNYSGAVCTPSIINVKSIHCGPNNNIVVLNDNTIKSFGDNYRGQLGMGDKIDYNGLVVTPSITNVNLASCGEYHTILLLNDGTIKSFGGNTYGQLGKNNTTNYNGAIQTPSFTNVQLVSVGWNFSFIIYY